MAKKSAKKGSSSKKSAKRSSAKASSKKSTKKIAKKSKNNRKNSDSRNGFWRLLSPVLIFVLSFSFLVFLLWVALLDFRVRDKFEGKRWSVPAKVYSRPLELYEGLQLHPKALIDELERLQYENVSSIDKPGTYRILSSSRDSLAIELRTKGFSFSDSLVESAVLKMRFKDKILIELNQALVRLEPQLIGGIYPNHNEDRLLINLEQTPKYLIEALVLVEDKVFFDHFGVSPKGILRAAFVNLFSGELRQGGSTLTQQLVKNFYLSSERTLTRKLNEALMAILLESHYKKNEILEAYLNEVHLGQIGSKAIHGFGLASEHYFGQPLENLELHQVALLIAMVKGPSWYEPRRNPERATERRNLVLSLLAENRFISDDEFVEYSSRPLEVTSVSSLKFKGFPAFLELVKRQLKQEYSEEDLNSEGLRIFTSLDPILQTQAEQSLVETIERLNIGEDQENQLQGAVVVVMPQTGEVAAMVGGTDVRMSGFNRALDAKRPVGSLLKPAIYLTALESGKYNWASQVDDNPVFVDLQGHIDESAKEEEQTWSPRNFDRKIHGIDGQVTMIEAMSKSYNQASVRLGMSLGVDNVIETIKRLGFNREIPSYPSVLLGAVNMSPFEVSQIYQTIAGGGFNTPMRAIREVQSSQGQILSTYSYSIAQVISSDNAYMINAGLQQVASEGTARSVYNYLPKDLDIAGKTGTTNEQRDSWFVGYTGNMLATVWLGKDDNSQTAFTGSSGALKVWSHLAINTFLQEADYTRPQDVDWRWLVSEDLLVDGDRCEHAINVPVKENESLQKMLECQQKNKSVIRRFLGL